MLAEALLETREVVEAAPFARRALDNKAAPAEVAEALCHRRPRT